MQLAHFMCLNTRYPEKELPWPKIQVRVLIHGFVLFSMSVAGQILDKFHMKRPEPKLAKTCQEVLNSCF